MIGILILTYISYIKLIDNWYFDEFGEFNILFWAI